MKTIGKTVGGKTVRVREEPRGERQPAKRGAAPEPKPEAPQPEGKR